MASYGYGPPPPAPSPAQPNPSGYAQYPQPGYPQVNGHRGGRGGHQASVYGYNPQPPQPYAQQNPGGYHGTPPPQGSYPAQPWQHDQSHANPPQPLPPHSSLPPQNYHPNYAPQMYQQQPYAQGTPYPPPAQPLQQAYAPQYGAAHNPAGPPVQSWGGAAPHPPPNTGHFGRGRGRGGHHSDRGSSKAQMMGPPIRLGFDNSNGSHDQAALVGNAYPPQPYVHPPSGPTPPFAPGPYQGYPLGGAPQATSLPPYDSSFSQSGRTHGRGGFHSNSFRGRSQSSGDKMRHKKAGNNTSMPNSVHQKPDAASSAGKKKKRKTNTLGLTPGDESDDDDVDEEAKLLELIGPDAPNPTDLAAWIAERKRNFPSQARTKARLAEASKAERTKSDGGRDSAASALEKQQQKADKLRKQLEKVESSIKRKREQQDEGDEMRDIGASTSVSSDSKSDDEEPEALTSRPEPAAFIPPPPKKADPSKHCKYYSTGGTCGKKGKCRFVHDSAVREAALRDREMNGGRMTLQQRLILNDKDQEDLTIVKTLQYLKEKGVMQACSTSITADPSVATTSAFKAHSPSTVPSSTEPSSLPPAPVKTEEPPSLPPQPPPSMRTSSSSHTVHYHGWNLSGFGNTGVKPDEL